MWSNKGWKHITAEEASMLHPGGTVSAHSGLFMCELCGQYVLLTDSYVQVRHFRHSSAEKSKDCPERTFSTGETYYFKAGEHELPLKIKLSAEGFGFELGFFQVPDQLLSKKLKIEIFPSLRNSEVFTFLKERLNAEGITYLSVGKVPSERYKLTVTGAQEDIYEYWPKSIQGVDPNGCVFEAATGKRLVYDSDVEVGKKYYLLKRGSIYTQMRHVSVREVRSVQFSLAIWKLYEVVAHDFDEESARFFLDYHCRLTEKPVSIQTVWPVYVETPYVIKHNQKSVVLHVRGNAPTMQVFPTAYMQTLQCVDGFVSEIQCNNRQQFISVGRTKALQYTYFWQEPLKETMPRPQAVVTDLKGINQESGIFKVLPEQRILRIQTPYDGAVLIKKNDVLLDKRKTNAGTAIEIGDISWGTEIQVIVGCDIVWSTTFIKEEKISVIDENSILNKLTSCTSRRIKIGHEIGGLASELKVYPQIRKWIYRCIRDGYMDELAFKKLQTWIVNAKKDNRGIL
jgi:hypothetical protein